jgi:hypothetical protein
VTLLLDGIAGPLAPDQGDHLKTILKSVNQLHAMIRDLLEAARAESGKLRVEQRCISLAELVHQVRAMLRPLADEKRIGLEVGIDQRLPLVYADPDRVLEVLINLVDNAIKFTPEDGAVMVQANVVDADPASVYVAVSDSGRGISPEAKNLIFERLYQDPDSIDNNRSGLGLGLFICKEIVRLHEGRLWVSSEPGQGSTFTFTLPVYSLAKLLAPIIVYQERLRPSLVLVHIELTPRSNFPRGNWKETWQQSLETVRRCIYPDKDLVLPPMGTSGAGETLFVVASTDLQRSGIMTTRIREQLEKADNFKEKFAVAITTLPVEIDSGQTDQPVGRQVQAAAECVTQMILKSMERKHSSAAKAAKRPN